MTDDNLGSFYVGRRKIAEPKRTMPKGLLTVVTVLAFGGIVWYAYPQGAEKYTDVNIPVITADTTPYKSKPENPGGMDVPHQDSTVFDSLDKKDGAKKPSKVTQKKEEPVDKAKLASLAATKSQMILAPQMKPSTVPPPLPVKTADAAPTKTSTDISAAPPVVKVKPAAKTEAPAPAKPGAYIQLGAYKSEADAKKDWARLQKKYPAELKDLSLRTQKADLGAKGTLYRLQADAKTEEKAKKICAALTHVKTACLVVKDIHASKP